MSERKRCPSHNMFDCSPLFNGCTQLTHPPKQPVPRLLEDPDGAPYPEEVQRLRQHVPTDVLPDEMLVRALESVLNYWGGDDDD